MNPLVIEKINTDSLLAIDIYENAQRLVEKEIGYVQKKLAQALHQSPWSILKNGTHQQRLEQLHKLKESINKSQSLPPAQRALQAQQDMIAYAKRHIFSAHAKRLVQGLDETFNQYVKRNDIKTSDGKTIPPLALVIELRQPEEEEADKNFGMAGKF